jgi:HlyD family secretion protein
VIEVKVGAGDVVAPGSALATIARNNRSGETIALIYVPAGEGRRIQRGMRAELVPDTVEREVYGAIVGRVLSVSPLPATREGMRRILRNDQLVDQLLLGGAVTEVQVALQRDASTPSGFRWSSSRGPERGVGIGTLTGARIVIDRRRVLDWLLPGTG